MIDVRLVYDRCMIGEWSVYDHLYLPSSMSTTPIAIPRLVQVLDASALMREEIDSPKPITYKEHATAWNNREMSEKLKTPNESNNSV